MDVAEEEMMALLKERKAAARRKRRKLAPANWERVVKLRQTLCEKQGGRCYYCSVPMNAICRDPRQATLEHLVEVRDGGTWDDGNCVASCARCNQLRGLLLTTARRLEKALASPQHIPHQIHHLAERLTSLIGRWDEALSEREKNDH